MLMKQIVTAVLLPLFLGLMLSGCGAEDTVFLERAAEAVEEGNAAVQTEAKEGPDQDPEPFYVYVCGAVKTPGVYRVEQGARIFEAVALAGGFTEDASPESLNQALQVADGQMIRILTREEEEAQTAAGEERERAGGTPDGMPSGQESGKTAVEEDGLLDLNLASVSDLMALPGIGEAKAKRIVAYRSEHGAFSAKEELMNISGIKEGVYNRIRDYIKVK